jgi:hypothetical protein
MHWHLPKEFGKMIEFDFQGKLYRVGPGDMVYVDDSVDYAIEGRGLPLKKGSLNGAGVVTPMTMAHAGAKEGEKFRTLDVEDSIMAHDDGPPIEGLADPGPSEQHVDPMVGANPLAAFDQKRAERNDQERERLARGKRPQQAQGQPMRQSQQDVEAQQRAQHEQHHGKKHE